MVKQIIFLIAIITMLSISHESKQPTTNVAMFQGITGSNVFLVTNSRATLLVESGGFDDATSVLSFLGNNSITTIDLIFITHGHPDHFGGTGQIIAQYPGTPVGVSSINIKDELIYYAQLSNITDFDFTTNLQVLQSSNVLALLNLQVVDDFAQGESDYASALINMEDNYVLSGDVMFVDSHSYLGQTVDTAKVYNWIEINLVSFSTGERLGLNNNTVVYPGHGTVGDNSWVILDQAYLYYFINQVYTCLNGQFPSLIDLTNDMLNHFPTYLNTFIAEFTEDNPLWVADQEAFGVCSYSNPDYFGFYYEYHTVCDAASVLSCFSAILLFLSSYFIFF